MHRRYKINVNDILCSCKSDEERKKLYDKFSWMMQRGARLNNASSKPAKEYASAMNSLVEKTKEVLAKAICKLTSPSNSRPQ